ncbi:MAG: ComEC family competence protein [Muribaculaceae bacterium]|nr:ComEC family competence protein [Muribaculaceae bacterium]
MKHPLSAIPLLLPALSLVSGILTGTWLPWWVVFIPTVAAICLILLRRYYAMALTAIYMAGALAAVAGIPHRPAHPITGIPLTFSANVGKVSEVNSGLSLILEVNATGLDSSSLKPCRPFRVSGYIPDFSLEVAEGSHIMFKTALQSPTIERDIPDEFSFDEYLISKRIFYKAVINPDSVLAISAPTGLKARFISYREYLSARIYCSGLAPATKEFLVTAILGKSGAMDSGVREAFSSAGIAHILALSGMHVGVIALIIGLILYPLRLVGYRRLQSVGIITALWTYVLLTGASPSVVRAAVMLTVFITGRLILRHHSPLNSLCFAGIVILICRPEALYEPGFQMSFSAVLAILIFANRLNPIPSSHPALHTLASGLTTCVAAMLGTGMIATLYFHAFPVYFLLSNIIAGTLMAPLLTCGIIVTAGADASWLYSLTDSLYSGIEQGADFFASLPGATCGAIYFPAWVMVPYLIISLLLYMSLAHHRKSFILDCAMLLVTFILLVSSISTKPRVPALYLCREAFRTDIVADTGQGPLLFYTTASGRYASDAKDNVSKRLATYMGRRGIDSISTLDPHTASGILTFDGHTITTPNHSITILDSDTALPDSVTADYILLCRGFRMPLDSVFSRASTGHTTLIISYDMGSRRTGYAKRYCQKIGAVYHSMRSDGAFSLPISSSYPRVKK